MDTSSLPNSVRIYFERMVKEMIQQIVNEEAKKASDLVEKRVRETMPSVAMSMFDNWTALWENNQTTLCIRVDFKEPKTNAS